MITLNLIPPATKHDYQSSEQLGHVQHALVVLLLLMSIGTISLFFLRSFMQRHATKVHADLFQLNQQQTTAHGKDISATTGQINTTIKSLASALGAPRSWSTDVISIISGLPTTLTVSELTIQSTGQFHMIGLADNRQSFIELEAVLKANPKLTTVTTTSSASKRLSVPFDFTGQILPPTTK